MLHLLALNAGRPVHRETLVEALWPDLASDAAMRNVHVVVSSLRRLLDAAAVAGTGSFIRREGDTYNLELGAAADIDLMTFQAGGAAALAANAAGDTEAVIRGGEIALAAYRGEVLPEAGPAEWVVGEREYYRMQAAEVAQLVADAELRRHQPRAAVAACDRGLRIDRYRDSLWHTQISAYELLGETAGAARVRLSYERVLADLGVGGTGRA